MKQSIALGCCIALTAATAVQAEDATFKAYGFMDARANSQWYSEENFLRQYGIITPNTQLYVDHVNTYFDWKPSSNVRVLAELSLNRDAAKKTEPGKRLGFDSASVYSNVYSQVGSATQAGFLLFLQNTAPYSGLPASFQQHIADSLTRDTLSKTVHAIGRGVRAQAALSNPTNSTKDHGISIPRIHADLLLTDEFNLRVGKFITPAGIWNVDHGSPTILTVRQPYQTSFFPIFPEAQTGVQAFGKTVAADQDLSYAAWLSTGRGGMDVLGRYDYGQDPQNLDDWAGGAHLQADLSVLDGIRLGGSFQTGTMRESEEWSTIPVTKVDVATSTPITDLASTSSEMVDLAYARELCYGLDTKVTWNKLLLQGEWNHRKVLNLQNDRKATDFNAWYVLVSRTFPVSKNVDLTPYALYEAITWDNPENNPTMGLADIPAKGFGTAVAGLNIGLFSSVRLKLEYSHVVLDPVQFASGNTANTYTDSDLSIDEFDTQFSVAF